MDNQTHCDTQFQTESSFGGGCQDFMGQGGHDQQFDPTMADLSNITNMMGQTQLTAGGDFGGHNSGGLSLL